MDSPSRRRRSTTQTERTPTTPTLTRRSSASGTPPTSAPTASAPAAPSHNWLLTQWQSRGLLSADASADDIARAHGDTWFMRRNRHTPHVAETDHVSSAGWVARRNHSEKKSTSQVKRQLSEATPSSRRTSRSRSRSGAYFLEAMSDKMRAPPHATPAADLGDADEESARPRVWLTLYDLASCNACAHHVGLGIYHSGIEVHGVEYTYDCVDYEEGASGLTWHPPFHTQPSARLPLRARLLLGHHACADARAAHADLRACTPEWTSDDYDVLANNCHHWAEAALGVLGVAAPIPPWVDRSTRWMRFFSGVAVGTEERGGGGAVERAPLLPRG